MPVRVGYYEAARRTTWECSCGWHGRFEEMVQGLSSELIEASCPACDAHLALIDLPTIEDTRRSAAAGRRGRGVFPLLRPRKGGGGTGKPSSSPARTSCRTSTSSPRPGSSATRCATTPMTGSRSGWPARARSPGVNWPSGRGGRHSTSRAPPFASDTAGPSSRSSSRAGAGCTSTETGCPCPSPTSPRWPLRRTHRGRRRTRGIVRVERAAG